MPTNARDDAALAAIKAKYGNEPFKRGDIDSGAINRLIYFGLIENLDKPNERNTTRETNLRVNPHAGE